MLLEIRVANEADLPAILSLYERAGLDNSSLDLAQAREVFGRLAAYPNYHIYVAVADGQTVGTFGLAIMDNLSHHGARSGLVESVAVAPERQGEGIGRQMMDFAMARCREAGCYKLALSSNLKREAAHRFYESLGFRQHGYSFVVDLAEEKEAPNDPD